MPRAGDIICFPGWLSHRVAPNNGDRARISVAGNLQGLWGETSAGLSSVRRLDLD